MKRKLIAASLLGALFFLSGATWLAGTILTSPAPHAMGQLPTDIKGKAVQFDSESGSTIHGWFIPGATGAGAVLLMHGVRANRLSMLDRTRFLSRAGYSVLLFDFQAHGESGGKHITFGYLESRDAQAAVKFLHTVVPGERIGAIGVSMGGAAALLASPPLNVQAMVLEMVYPTIDEAVADRLSIRLGGWARFLTPLLTWQLKPRLGLRTEDLRPIDRLDKINAAKLFIAGSDDLHTTIAESRRLYEAAPIPKDFWVVPGASHIDFHQAATDEYESRVLAFFHRYLQNDQTTQRARP
jgi:fermentation-respiration switch protein FrsA (DUF1100 family)